MLVGNPLDPTLYTITIKVMDGSTWYSIAPDASGLPGDWQAGNVALTLTESGQNTGCVSVRGAVPFWIQWEPPAGTQPDDYRPATVRLYTESL